ncbi:hypothetical protein WA538_004077, partial [Blastocystis sp. DL]
MFAWETVQAVIRHNSNYFYFFTITTNLLTWIYFISKASYVLFGHMQDVQFRNCRTKTDSIFANYSLFISINIFFVAVVFWGMLAFQFKWSFSLKSTFSVFDHLIVPTLKVVDLFFFTPLEFNVPLIYGLSIGYPLLYLAVSMVRGHFVHFYPYW